MGQSVDIPVCCWYSIDMSTESHRVTVGVPCELLATVREREKVTFRRLDDAGRNGG